MLIMIINFTLTVHVLEFFAEKFVRTISSDRQLLLPGDGDSSDYHRLAGITVDQPAAAYFRHNRHSGKTGIRGLSAVPFGSIR